MVTKMKHHIKDLVFIYPLFKATVDRLVRKIKSSKVKYDSIHAIPRGGFILGVYLSHALKLPMVKNIKVGTTLICDDICDTGKTLETFKYNDKVVLVAKDKGIAKTERLIYGYTIGDEIWVKFHWEVE